MTIPEFFGGISGISEEARIKNFDSLLSLFYEIGIGSDLIISCVDEESKKFCVEAKSSAGYDILLAEISIRNFNFDVVDIKTVLITL